MIETIWTAMCIGFVAFATYLAYVYAKFGAQAVGEALDQVFDVIYRIDNVHHEDVEIK